MISNINNPWVPELFRIEEIARETEDVFTLNLLPTGKKNPVHFEPGQFNMLYVYGVGEIPLSISGNPGEQEKRIHTVRAVGAVTQALSRLKRGDKVGVRGPFGSKWPTENAKGSDVVIVAGGLGLAPLRPLIYKILSEREIYRSVFVLYGTRSPHDIIYSEELDEWRECTDVELDITVDMSDKGWHGNVGVVTTLIKKAGFDPENTCAYICGPEIMMRYSVVEMQKYGVEEENIFIAMERNMKCAIGFCGRCQFGPDFICKDGPVFSYNVLSKLIKIRGI
ncbi:MAG: Ni/Fe hydrogenase subunit gamma [Candidatus Dadabacteria bacterium]|nr:Ni/Fe hydrogenase subunit gamma [Candidatus Dadabacteria bacterium]NIQ13950.1 Ni/Fe hydrogenase subunit gamma [Candidatus Dadabacteria bacterium]